MTTTPFPLASFLSLIAPSAGSRASAALFAASLLLGGLLVAGVTACNSEGESGADTRDTTGTSDTGSGGDDTARSDDMTDDGMVLDLADDAVHEDDGSGPDGAQDDMADMQEAPPIPTDSDALEAWLAAGHYESWPAESGPHDSDGPHFGTVRVFVSPELEASLAAGNTQHPAGAAAVKELYGDGTPSQIEGYSVEVKLDADSAGGDNWYWYERFGTSVYADGNGASICTNCHTGGQDFVLTPCPLQ